MMKKKTRIIALYLPQYHPIQENDEWWGKGFTEWTNVGKAKSLFKGHYQPRVPADLGYYDLRMPEIREAQAEMAREAGIEGFCYWHYWFGNGKRLLERPFNEVLESGKPDFPFCLGWANHSWYAKTWNPDGSKKDKLLIKQTYNGEKDYRNHFDYILKAFKDKRYIKCDNKPVFSIFDAANLPMDFIPLWNQWAKQEGFEQGIYFIANVRPNFPKQDLMAQGFSAVTYQRVGGLVGRKSLTRRVADKLISVIKHRPAHIFQYKDIYPSLVGEEENLEDVIPVIVPNWDHTPRSGMKGSLFIGSTPELFKKHVQQVLCIVKPKHNKLVFLKSWNEWAEGNYMEPDLKYGKGYIHALREMLDNEL
jgi:hypothetical protein